MFKTGDKTKLTNYRPISLLSCFSKTLEKIVYHRVIKFLNKNSVFSPYQFGFRPGCSTVHTIVDIIAICNDNINQQLCSGILFLDLSKAFDTVDHEMLLSKLEHYGMRGVVKDFFTSYLSNRKQYVHNDNYNSQLKDISVGVPQGSTLGPFLFLIYINDLPNKVVLIALLNYLQMIIA